MNSKASFIRYNWKSNWKKIKGSGITLANNEMKDVIKVIKSLENRGVLLKGTTKKLLVKKKDLSIFRPLITAGLLLMKSVLTPLAKSVLISLGSLEGMSAADAAI